MEDRKEAINEQLEHLKNLYIANLKRLRVLELKNAQLGYNTPPEVITEIEELRNKVGGIQEQIDKLTSGFSQFNAYDLPYSDDKTIKCLEITLKGNLKNWSIDMQNAAIRAFAAIMEIPTEQVRLIRIEGGSIKILLGVPSIAAQRLLSLYKTRDKTLKYIGVKKIKIVDIDIIGFTNMSDLELAVLMTRLQIVKIETKMSIAFNFMPLMMFAYQFNILPTITLPLFWFGLSIYSYLILKANQLKQTKITQIEVYYKETISNLLDDGSVVEQFLELEQKAKIKTAN